MKTHIPGPMEENPIPNQKTPSLTGDPTPDFLFNPLTPERWSDFETLFGPRGACGGCWCMWFRLKRSIYEAQIGEGNRQEMKAIVASGEVPGLLAYTANSQGVWKPVGWCSVEPRPAFPVLDRSRLLKPVDGQPVWSVVCFFIAKPYRRQGLTVRLLQAAVEYASGQGATIVEGYPIDSETKSPDPFVFTGLVSAFRQAGFQEVARRSPRRPIMRFIINP